MVESGSKYDNNKPSMALIDADFLLGLAKVLDFGKEKYAAHNWRGGISFSRLISAAYRHLGAINKGEDLDSESSLPHVYHLACCVMFLSWMMENRKDLDDRWSMPTSNTKTLMASITGGYQPVANEYLSTATQAASAPPYLWPNIQNQSFGKTPNPFEEGTINWKTKVNLGLKGE